MEILANTRNICLLFMSIIILFLVLVRWQRVHLPSEKETDYTRAACVDAYAYVHKQPAEKAG